MSSVAESLESLFLLYGWTWKIDGEDLIPNEDDIQAVLDEAKRVLYASDEYNELQVGHLVFKREGEHLDVYFRVGDVNDTDD